MTTSNQKVSKKAIFASIGKKVHPFIKSTEVYYRTDMRMRSAQDGPKLSGRREVVLRSVLRKMRAYYISQIFKQGMKELKSLSDKEIIMLVNSYMSKDITSNLSGSDQVINKEINCSLIEIMQSTRKL